MIQLRIYYDTLPASCEVRIFHYYDSVYRCIHSISKMAKRFYDFPVLFVIKKIN